VYDGTRPTSAFGTKQATFTIHNWPTQIHRNCVDGLEQREGHINDDAAGDCTGAVAVAVQE
jgi:hypothetical protein